MIIAPNHFSFLDHFFVAVYLRRKVHFMAKSQLFKRPMQFIYTHGGVFPVRRGHHDEEAFKTAHAVLARGDIVVMYAEAGRSRSGELNKPRHGLGRLALESGAPVVPTAIAGTERVRNWRRLQFPKVTDPVRRADALRARRRAHARPGAGGLRDGLRRRCARSTGACAPRAAAAPSAPPEPPAARRRPRAAAPISAD